MPKLHTSVNFTPYLPSNAEAKLAAYVYRGDDRSLIYKHMWRPLCRTVAPYLPYWLAPNVITVTALLVVIANHISLYMYLPNLKPEPELYGDCPWYLLVLCGVGLMTYQLLDNLDGHQARRLGVSSPLGLLMDHGCDAFNCIIGALSICAATGLGPSWRSWWIVLSTLITFFMNTWEEFYRGELVLPEVNGPNEGLFIAVIIYFTSAMNGIQFWTTNFIAIPTSILPDFLQREALTSGLMWFAEHTHFARLGYLESRPWEMYVKDFVSAIFDPHSATSDPNARYQPFGAFVKSTSSSQSIEIGFNTVFCLLMCFAAGMTALGNIYQVFVAVKKEEEEHRHGRYGNGWFVTHYPFLHALTRLFPLAVVSIIANMWMACSPTGVFEQNPRLFCWTVGLLFTKLAVHLMVAHLCSVEFHPFRRTLVPFFYVIGHFLFSIYKNHQIPHIDESVTLFEFCILSAIPFAHLAINVITEMSETLKVSVFTVPKAKQIAARERDLTERIKLAEERQRKAEMDVRLGLSGKLTQLAPLPPPRARKSATAAADSTTTTSAAASAARPSATRTRTPTKSEEAEHHNTKASSAAASSAAPSAARSSTASAAAVQSYGTTVGASPAARKPTTRTSSAKPKKK